MAIDKAKLLKSAEKFIAGGKVLQAIDEYLKILKENPKDWNLMIQIGDLYLKISKTGDAIAHFQRVADHYYSDGFFLKAIAIYKRVNKLDPNLTEICIKLADLYLKQGLTMDAKSQLQVVAQHYISKNQVKDAIQTFKKLIEIEPDNLKTRNELAKAFKSEGMITEAIQEYLEISDELTRKGLLKESLAVLETAYKLDSRNIAILRKILSIYAEQNETVKATALLEETLRVDPSNSEVLGLLAESYAAKNQYEKAQEAIDRAITNTTQKEPFWVLKGDFYLRQGDLDRAFSQYSLVVERQVQRKEVDKAVTLMQKVARTDASFHPALQKLIDLYSMLRQETNVLSTYSSLVDAYISKAMYQDASKVLEKLISIEPDNAQHHEKLEFVRSFLEKPKPEVKIPEKEFEVEPPEISEEVSSSDFDLSINLEAEPEPSAATYQEKPAPAPVPAPTRVVPQPKPTAMPAAAGVEAAEEEKEFVSEHLIEAEVFTKYGLIDKAIEQLQIVIGKYPHSVLGHQKLKEIYLEKGERDKAVEECVVMSRIFRKQGDLDQAEDLLSEARQISPNHPALDKAYKELPAGAGAADVFGEIEKLAQSMKVKPAAAKAQPVTPKPSPKPPAPPPVQEIEIEVEEPAVEEKPVSAAAALPEDTFEEIDFYVDQGLTSEARKLLYVLKEKHPNDPGISRRLVKMGEKVAPAPPLPVMEEAPAEVPAEAEEAPQEEISIDIEEEMELPSLDISPQVEEEVAIESLVPSAAEETSFDISVEEEVMEEEASIQAAPQEAEEEISVGLEESLEIAEEAPEVEVAAQELQVSEVEQTWDLGDLTDLSTPMEISAEPEEEVSEIPEEEAIELEPVELEIVEPEIPEAPPEVVPEVELEALAEIEEHAEEMSEEEGIPPSFEEIGELDGAEFGELEEAPAIKIEEPAEEKITEPEPVEEQAIGDAVDAAFAGVDEEALPTTPVKASEELFEEEDDFFDLAAELEEGFLNVQSAVEEERPTDGQNYSLEEILSDFKKGVEKQLGSEDYDTRYNLGIAYKEMGLIDEAIAEFQIASKDQKRFLECCSMLGLCFVEKGMPKLAVKWYERGLETKGYNDEEYQGLRFEMAQAYEAMGEMQKALEAFQEVYGANAGYRNVAKKMKDLQDQLKKTT